MKIIDLLKQRRIWAGLFAAIAFFLQMANIPVNFDAGLLTDSVMKLIQDISSILAIALPVISYFFPKKNQ